MAAEGTAQAVETTAPVANGAAEPQQMDPKFAALAKKEMWVREQQKQLAAEKSKMESDWKSKEQEYQSKYVPKDALRSADTAIPYLLDNGLNYDQITEYFLKNADQANPINQTIRQLQNKIASLESAQEQSKKSAQETQASNYAQAVKQIEIEIKDLVNTTDEFPVLKASGKIRPAVKLIEEYFKDTGDVLSAREAAAVVEEWELEAAIKVAQVEKVQAKLAPKQEAVPVPQKQEKKNNEVRVSTITNAMTSSTKPMSARERAILAFQGKLK